MAARKLAYELNVLIHFNNKHYDVEHPYIRVINSGLRHLAALIDVFDFQLPPIVPGAPVKLNFKISAMIDKYDGLPPQDLTTENSFVRVMIIKSEQVRYNLRLSFN